MFTKVRRRIELDNRRELVDHPRENFKLVWTGDIELRQVEVLCGKRDGKVSILNPSDVSWYPERYGRSPLIGHRVIFGTLKTQRKLILIFGADYQRARLMTCVKAKRDYFMEPSLSVLDGTQWQERVESLLDVENVRVPRRVSLTEMWAMPSSTMTLGRRLAPPSRVVTLCVGDSRSRGHSLSPHNFHNRIYKR